MNFKKMMKRGQEGFTLVELIVVIAVLGILGGIAVPAYSGYVEKANYAADEALLAELNTAFAAACAVNGENHIGRSDASAKIDKGVVTVTVSGIADFGTAFGEFFEGETAIFKVMTALNYDGTLGMFTDMEAAIAQLKEYLDNSSFSNVSLNHLTGDVADMVGELAGFLSDPNNLQTLVGGGFATYLEEKLGIVDVTTADPNKLADAAVLYLASSATGMTDKNIENATISMRKALMDAFVDESAALSMGVIDSISSDTGSSLANYAMLYATAEAIALANGGKDGELYQNLKNVDVNNKEAVITATTGVFSNVDQDVLEEYLILDMPNDMNAYFKALQALNTKESELLPQVGTSDKLFTESDAIKDLLTQLGG